MCEIQLNFHRIIIIKTKKKQVTAHRQAWAWQDEWYGMSMEDIREFERETQLLLQRKMGLDGEDEDEDGKINLHKSDRLMLFKLTQINFSSKQQPMQPI